MTDLLPTPGIARERSAPPPPPRRSVGVMGRWWFAICTLTLIVASDYKVRVRDPKSTLSGSIDPTVMIELALYGLVGLYLVLARARPPRIGRTQPHLYLALLFVGLMVLSVVYTAYPQYALVRAGQMCVLLGLMLAVVRTGTSADLHRFVHGYIVLVSISVLYGIARPSPPVNRLQVGRFTWLAIHPTTSGVLAGLAVVAVVAYLAAGRSPRAGPVWPRGLYVAALVLVGGGALGSQTRGAVVGALLAIVVVLVSLRGGRALVEMQIVLVVVVIGVALAAGPRVVSYFERGEKSAQLTSLNSRTDLWETAADAIERRPMFGYGVTSSRGIFYDELGLGGGHNAVVNVFVELGLVGLVTWTALVVALVAGTARLPYKRFPQLRFDRALILGIITFLMVDGIFFDGPGSVTNVASTWFFCCIAWLAVSRRSIQIIPKTADDGDGSDDRGSDWGIYDVSERALSIDDAARTARLRRFLGGSSR